MYRTLLTPKFALAAHLAELNLRIASLSGVVSVLPLKQCVYRCPNLRRVTCFLLKNSVDPPEIVLPRFQFLTRPIIGEINRSLAMEGKSEMTAKEGIDSIEITGFWVWEAKEGDVLKLAECVEYDLVVHDRRQSDT